MDKLGTGDCDPGPRGAGLVCRAGDGGSVRGRGTVV